MITVIGSLSYDLVTYTNKVPDAGETFQANTFENHLGGKGLNETLACARLSQVTGDGVRMIGNVGSDSFGKELRQALVDANVDTTHVKTIENQSSGVAVILVESSGENRILIIPGANGDLKPQAAEMEKYFSDSRDGEFVVLQNEFPYTMQVIEWLKANKPGLNIAYNPSPFKKDFISSSSLQKLDLLIVNEGEALDVAECVFAEDEMTDFQATISADKQHGFQILAAKLQQAMNQENVSAVIITMGASGSVFKAKSQEAKFVASQKVTKVVDTTGAGDTFFGGVILQMSAGKSLEDAVKFATVASGLAIQKNGAAEGIPFYEEVQRLL